VVAIQYDGNVGIGTTSPIAKLDVASSIAISGPPSGGLSSTDHYGVIFYDGDLNIDVRGPTSDIRAGFRISTYNEGMGSGMTPFRIARDGVISGQYGTYHGPSDLRLKQDIVTIPNALDTVLALRGVTFRWKDATRDGGKRHLGMIAQEVEPIVPEVVHTADDAMQTKSVDYPSLAGLLIEAIKEQQAQIQQLQADDEALTARLDVLERKGETGGVSAGASRGPATSGTGL